MTKFKIVLLLIALSITSIGIFSAFSTSSDKSITYTLNDDKRDFSLSLTWDKEGKTMITEADQNSITDYLKKVFSEQNFETVTFEEVLLYINDTEEEYINKEIVSLVAKGTNSKITNMPIAVTFASSAKRTIGTGSSLSVADIHSCMGNPCNCCEFIRRNYTGLFTSTSTYIVGCKCSEADDCRTTGGQCNHTRTTGK